MKSFKALLEERNKAYRAVAVAEAAEEATKRRPELELPQLSKNGLGIKPDYSSKRQKLKKDDKPRAKKVRPQVKYIEINELDYDEFKEGNWDVALFADPTDETTNDAQNFQVAAHDLGVDQSVALFLHSATEKKAWVANFSTLDMKGSGPLSARIWKEFNNCLGVGGDQGIMNIYTFGQERVPIGLITRMVFVTSPSAPVEKTRRILSYFIRRFTLVIPPEGGITPPSVSSPVTISTPATSSLGEPSSSSSSPSTPPFSFAPPAEASSSEKGKDAAEDSPAPPVSSLPTKVTATEVPPMEVFDLPAKGPRKTDIKNTYATVGMNAVTGEMIWFLQSEQGYEEEEDEQMPSLDLDDEAEEAERDSDEEVRLEEKREKMYEWRFKKIEDVQVASWEEDDRKRAYYAYKQRLQAEEEMEV